jgi:hypothetical protein
LAAGSSGQPPPRLRRSAVASAKAEGLRYDEFRMSSYFFRSAGQFTISSGEAVRFGSSTPLTRNRWPSANISYCAFAAAFSQPILMWITSKWGVARPVADNRCASRRATRRAPTDPEPVSADEPRTAAREHPHETHRLTCPRRPTRCGFHRGTRSLCRPCATRELTGARDLLAQAWAGKRLHVDSVLRSRHLIHDPARVRREPGIPHKFAI